MTVVRLIMEVVGWCVVAPFTLWLSAAIITHGFYLAIRRRTDFVSLGPIGFYAGTIYPGSGVTLKDNTEWRCVFDRWFIRKRD